MPNPQALSKIQMRHEIQRLNRINSDISSYQTIQNIYRNLFNGIKLIVSSTKGHDVFFRARVNPPTHLEFVKDLLPPPAELVIGFQRCNAPHNPRFYCSSRRVTALRECRVKAGDIVYLSEWMGQKVLPINVILDADDKFGISSKLNEAELMFYSHLDTIFTRRIHQTFSNDYKFSAAAAEQMTRDFSPGKNEIASDGLIGFRYPSVLDLANSYNICFPAEFALDRLHVHHVMKLRIENVTGDDVEASFLDAALNFDDGKIMWTNDPLCLPVPRAKNGGILLRKVKGRAQVVTVGEMGSFSKDTHNYLNELLEE